MSRLLALCLALALLVAGALRASAQSAPGPATAPDGAVRFEALDILLDSGPDPLAAYQLELSAAAGSVTIVGIEGGDHAAFRAPPYYDPAAMRQDRVILAALDTGEALPTGRTRVARVHVRVSGDQAPRYTLTLTTAGTIGGRRITPTAALSQGGSQ